MLFLFICILSLTNATDSPSLHNHWREINLISVIFFFSFYFQVRLWFEDDDADDNILSICARLYFANMVTIYIFTSCVFMAFFVCVLCCLNAIKLGLAMGKYHIKLCWYFSLSLFLDVFRMLVFDRGIELSLRHCVTA